MEVVSVIPCSLSRDGQTTLEDQWPKKGGQTTSRLSVEGGRNHLHYSLLTCLDSGGTKLIFIYMLSKICDTN
jgi:hypothetical protein